MFFSVFSVLQIILGVFLALYLFNGVNIGFVCGGLIIVLLVIILRRKIFSNQLGSTHLSITDKLVCGLISVLLMITYIKPASLGASNFSWKTIGFCFISFFFFFFFLKDSYRVMLFNSLEKKGTQNKFIKYFVPFFIVSFIYYLAYYPGVFFIDSINQWEQIFSNSPWNDWHPVAHTFVLKITTIIGHNPATFTLFQIVVYSLIMAYVFNSLGKWFFQKNTLVAPLVYFLFIPLFPLFSVYIIKDSLYCYFLIWLTCIMVNIIMTNGNWLLSNKNLLALFFADLGFIFFRHNGWPVFLLSSIILLIFLFNKRYLRLHMMSICCIIVYLFVTGPLYNRLEVIKGDSTETLGVLVQTSANIINNKGKMNADEKDYFYSIMTEKNWNQLYDPLNVDAIKFKGRFKKEVIRDNESKFIKKSVILALENPTLAMEAYLNQIKILWKADMAENEMRPFFRDLISGKQGPYYFMTEENRKKYRPNYISIDLDSITKNNKFIHEVIGRVIRFIMSSNLYLLLMPSLYLIVIIFSLLIIIRKGNLRLLLPFLYYLLNLGTLFIGIPAQDVRYVFVNYVTAFIAFAVASSRGKVGITENGEES